MALPQREANIVWNCVLCNIIMALPQPEANIVWNCVNIFILITSIEDDVKHEILNA